MTGSNDSRARRLFRELSRRHVFRIAGLYLVAGWVVIQVVATVGPALRLPAWTLTLAVVLVAAGLPIALLVAYAFELTPEGPVRTAPLAADPPAPTTGEPTIAVLDFDNVASDPDLDWLGGGIAETVTADLRRIAALRVVGRERVHRTAGEIAAAGEEPSPGKIGRRLALRWLLAGGFQRLGGRLRITAHVVEVASGTVVASTKVDGDAGDLFALQDRIIVELMEPLEVEIGAEEMARIREPETSELEAYEWHAKGREAFLEFGPEGLARAHDCFRRAIDADPGYALAYSGLGATFVFRYIRTTDPRDLREGVARLERALELDDSLSEPDEYLAYAYTRQGRLRDAVASGTRAIEKAPDRFGAHYFLGVARVALAAETGGSYATAAATLANAIRLEPRFEPSFLVLSWIHLLHGDYGPAADLAGRAARLEETEVAVEARFVGGDYLRAEAARWAGDAAAAGRLYERSARALEGSSHVYAPAFDALTRLGRGELGLAGGDPGTALAEADDAVRIVGENARGLGMGWIRIRAGILRARALAALGREAEADDAFDAASDAGVAAGLDFGWIWNGTRAQVEVDRARYLAGRGHPDAALDALAAAIDAGWPNPDRLAADPALAPLRGSPRWADLLGRLETVPGLPLPPDEAEAEAAA